jgi:hypothetical protein
MDPSSVILHVPAYTFDADALKLARRRQHHWNRNSWSGK